MGVVTLIVSVLEGAVKVFNVTRESLADSLDDIAKKVRNGELIAEELFQKAHADKDKMNDIRSNLPD